MHGLRQRLESQHPNLCTLLNITIAVLLYADDAALPADSLQDLQLSADLFQQFCDENRLFIATSKSYITVFHPEADSGIVYSDGS
eukprot:10089321-Karenia_brevis.AAC.1